MSTTLFEDLTNSIQQLILLGKGDVGRLEYILDLLKRGKLLPDSDQKYLENILPLYLGPKDFESPQYERKIEELLKEIETLNEKLSRLEKKGFEKLGKKAIFFFVTVFVGWNVLQSYVISSFNLDMSDGATQYIFPLNVLANYFDAGYLITFIFILMILAWPFISAVSLVNYIKTRKLYT